MTSTHLCEWHSFLHKLSVIFSLSVLCSSRKVINSDKEDANMFLWWRKGKGLKTGAQWYTFKLNLHSHACMVLLVSCQFFFTFMFFINYGLKCLDEQLKINNTVDTRIQIKQSTAQQWSSSVGITSQWLTIHAYFVAQPMLKLWQEMM